MNIAILVWGSLFWDPRDLAFNGEWHYDGPPLPIEFARISGGNRVTLVIKPGYPTVPTLYCVSTNHTLADARENLRAREGTDNINNIGYLDFSSDTHQVRRNNSGILETIRIWNIVKNFDAVIWSDFAPNFQDTLNVALRADTICNFVRQLSPTDRDIAIAYIMRAPMQIETRFRTSVTQILNDPAPHNNQSL
jgi:hypothetical protein